MADDRLARYPQAMEVDPKTDKLMPKVFAETGQYVRHSTNPKPIGTEGNTLYLWDTKQAYIHDGTDWRLL